MIPMPAVPAAVTNALVTETSAMPLEAAALRCDARAGVARVVLAQRFENGLREPMHVIYTLPLPADAAVSGFRFRIGERTIEGTVDKRARARERFEEAVANGQTAALLEQERASLFTQEIGNVPPGVEVVCEIEMDQKLRWLDDQEGAWEWRFPLAAAPRYLGAPGRVTDAGNVAFDVAERIAARASLTMRVRDDVVAARSPESPSHALSVVAEGAGFRVELGSGNAASLDRDVVVRWPVACGSVRTTLDVAGPRDGRVADAHALLTIVPPRKDVAGEPVPRDLTLLLDTSGSMSGAPIAQAKRVALALIDSLGERDRFEAIEFSVEPRRFRASMLAATSENKRAVSAWLRDLEAGGGTEMRSGILEALHPRGDRSRDGAIAQVVLVTDGLIGFEQEIVREILALLPSEARLHAVGVGSSVNRSLTAPAARAGRGVEVVIGLGEDPERAVSRILARSVAPVVTEIEASGSALLELAPRKIPDLFAGAPVLVSARVRPEGGEIVLRGKSARGAWEERVRVAPAISGEGSDAVVALYGRERVEDEEMQIAAGTDARAADAQIELLGLSYRVATRLTSWLAIDSQPSVDPRDPSRRVEMPQALPYGMSVEGLGLRASAPTLAAAGGNMNRTRTRSALVQGRAAPPTLARPAAAAPAPSAPRREMTELDDLDGDEKLEAMAEPEVAKKPTFFERVRGAFTDRSSAIVAWIGRIVVEAEGRLTIEIVVEGRTLDWKSALDAMLVDRSGSSQRVAVDATRTTRAGTYESGTVVRFTLLVPAGFDGKTLAQVAIGGVQVEIR